jgi:transposase
MGVFDRIFAGLASEGPKPGRIMIDATHLKAHRTAASLLKKGVHSRCIGRTKGGLNPKLHAICDDVGRPLVMLLAEGQMSDHKGAKLMLGASPPAKALLGKRGYDSSWLREALADKGIEACIPSSKSGEPRYLTTGHSTASATASRHVRQAQGLAAHRHTLRPMRPCLLFRHLHRGSCGVLVAINES